MSVGSKYVKDYTHCPFASKSNIIDCGITVKEFNAETIQYVKNDFSKIIKSPNFFKLDGYIVSIKTTINSMNELTSGFRKLMHHLNDELIYTNMQEHNWRFRFEEETFFVVVMSSIYTPNSTRWVPEGHFILFQPEHSFHKHISRENREMVSSSIRKVFLKHGCDYAPIIMEAAESQKYIFPLNQEDKLINWWHDRPE